MSEEIKLNSSRNLKKYCFPDKWRLVELGEIFSLQQGKALSQKNQTGKFGQPFLRTANILWGHLDLSNVDQMDFTENEMNRFALKPKDLLICEGGEIGRTAIWSGQIEPCFHQNHIHRLRLLRGDVEPEFVMYWMQAAIKLLGLFEGEGNKTTIPNLSKARLSRFLVPLPPLPEQRAIARALRAVQGAREARMREVALERERKAALMEHLFTHGTSGESTKTTEIGEMPESWQVVKLGEVVASTQYGLSVCGNSEGNYPILRMNCLVEGRVNDSNLQFVDLTKIDFENFRLNKGDILFNRTNSSDLVGKTGLFNLEGNFVFASYLIRIAVDKNHLYTEFINYYINMNSTQTRLRMLASRGVSQSNINATKLKGFLIPLPQFAEQQAIARILKACDSKIAALDHEARLLQELFRAMLEELMSGRLPTGALVQDAD